VIPTDKQIMNSVRAMRTETGLSQSDFGRLLGKSLPTIQRWETIRPPRGRALAELLDLSKKYSGEAVEKAAAIFLAELRKELTGLSIQVTK
jgi:DNA-binding transcriptional regulator YiaG